MKPLNITISAFMAYAGTEYIDFTDLGNQGLYLITGETGAGKTTIFDAISYALYGQPSGDVRSPDMLRSKYAPAGVETYVEMTFLCNGKEYTIRRAPKYERPKKSGVGITVEQASEQITCDHQILNSKELPVTKIVEQIVGLDKNQFCQIAMLAQGDFQKLLLAETKYKEMIFRHIFNTNSYKYLQDKVSNDFIQIKNKKDREQEHIDQYIKGIMVDEDDVLSIDVSKAKNNELLEEDVIKLLEQLISNDQTKLINLNKQLAASEQKIVDNNAKLKEAQRYHNNLNKLKELSSKLEQLNDQHTLAKSQLLDALTKEDEIKKIQALVGELSSKEDEFDLLENKKEILKNNTTAYKILADKTKTMMSSFDELKLKLETSNKELDALKDLSLDTHKLITLEEELKRRIELLEKLSIEYIVYKKSKNELLDLQEELLKATSQKERCDNDLTHKEILWAKEQAGILASTLEQGNACPVCGSTSHPHLAELSLEAPSKKELEQAKKDAKKADDAFRKVSEQTKSKKTLLDDQTSRLLKDVQQLLGHVDVEVIEQTINQTLKETNDSLKQTTDSIAKANHKAKQKEMLEKFVSEANEKITDQEAVIQKNKDTLLELNTTLKESQKQIDELTSKLGYGSKADLLKVINNHKVNIKTLEDVIKTTRNNEKKIGEQLSQLQGEQNQIKKDNQEIKYTDIENLMIIDADLLTHKKEFNLNRDIVNSRLSNNENLLKNITSEYALMKDTIEEYIWMNTLNNTLNGKIKGGEKVTLETYIQQSYFDRIVAKANKRFSIMTSGQYELIRNIPTLKNKMTGLDLDVIDHYNGSTRSVKSLSGGEKFKASLSLALGLSDMIQESSAGVRVDCMFVDEGFGSLDDASLNAAIDVLNSLSEGDRMIGIISHVGELERKIDKKIRVEKDARGYSHAKIELV